MLVHQDHASKLPRSSSLNLDVNANDRPLRLTRTFESPPSLAAPDASFSARQTGSASHGTEPAPSNNSNSNSNRSSEDEQAEVNPLFAISQRVQDGTLESVHVIDDRSVVSGRPPPSLLHPSTWSAPSIPLLRIHNPGHSQNNNPTSGKDTAPASSMVHLNGAPTASEYGRAAMARTNSALSTSSSSTGAPLTNGKSHISKLSHREKERERAMSGSSHQSGHSDCFVMRGEGEDDPAPDENTVGHLREYDVHSSKREAWKMKAHDWRIGMRERMHSGDSSSYHQADHHHCDDPNISSQLSRSPRSKPLPFDGRAITTTTTDPNTSTSEPVSMVLPESGTPRRSESPVSMIALASTHSAPNGTTSNAVAGPSGASALQGGPVLAPIPRVPSSPRFAIPVLNAPGYLVTNSRIPPVPTTATGASSEDPSIKGHDSPSQRLVPIDSLTRPLLPGGIPLTTVTSASSGDPSSMSPSSRPRRSHSSAETAHPGFKSPPMASTSLLPPLQVPQRITAASMVTSPESSAAPYDEVESSIAAQAEVIRKKRQEKRAEQETSGDNYGASSNEDRSGRPGAPMIKRRSTRLGSGDGPGTGVLVGNLIGQDHANYVLMYNMLTGIRIGVSGLMQCLDGGVSANGSSSCFENQVSRCQAKLKRPLTDADYTARHKFSFDIVGNELTPSVKYDFKFKDYAPWVFRELREYFYLDPSDYLVSLTAKYILSELGSPGKSGSFFYFSRDYRFIIKTIRHAEHKFLRSILKQYHDQAPRGKKIHFVIMNNLFPPHRDIHETYDLKGSAIGRKTPDEKLQENSHAILKDLNWIERERQLDLGPEKKALFEEQLRRDTELMQKLRIMDYSLLTGIHNVQRGNQDNLRDNMLTVFQVSCTLFAHASVRAITDENPYICFSRCQPNTFKTPRRKLTDAKRDFDAAAVRKAVQQSDPKALSETNKLPDQDTSERRMFLFYQDEGGIRATGDCNEDLGVIYYLGIIDILTPYTFVKKIEHCWKSFKHNGHMISAVPPQEYGDRFMAFIYSVIRGNDTSKRPRMYEQDQPTPPTATGKPKTE
ncbi:BQ2448_6436 [Microbotryum intermedium]|uniref:BQ2448_6436 protein n=1 Tax=Microbotryum intermedium TaxID=269621 RepID=A0A238FQ39_9BASI|nr:BQ2448_6436 [Microbotryum intermedium]